MNGLDIIIILIVLIEAYVWARGGFVRGFFSLGGFLLGLVGGAFLVPLLIGFVAGALSQLLLAILVMFTGAILGETLGRLISKRLTGFRKKTAGESIDGVLGAAFAVCMTLFITWLLAAALAGGPVRALNMQIRDSAIIGALNDQLPPAPRVLSQISSLVGSSLFPEVFIGPEPRPVEPVNPPTEGEVAEALANAGESTVRIEGLGCGGLKTGSGFIAAPGLVVTNAHVVAGLNNPAVVDINGKRAATTVLFDPDLDIAILETEGLAGEPLNVTAQSYSRGTNAVALGYPGGNALEADAAGILQRLRAQGRDIYGRDAVMRTVYALQTEIEQGNSGGPVVLPDGTVIGVVFARSVMQSSTGYAVTSDEVLPLIERAKANRQPVSTQECTR